MKTNSIFKTNLVKGIITEDMLNAALYSVNKRAKNCRDQERMYRNRRYDKYGNEEKYRDQKNKYYRKKEKLLSIIQPVCIHEESAKKYVKHYDYEDDFKSYGEENVNFERYGEYYDRDRYRMVEFVVVSELCKKYYLFYQIGDRSYHTPIEEEALKMHKGLDIVPVDQIVTYGEDILELVSVNFVDKVIALIESGDYTYEENKTETRAAYSVS